MLAGGKKISASLEDYLEAIFHTVEAKGAARAKDIVQRMGVHNSSVTQALRSLAEKKLVNYAPYDVITLTNPGERIARDVVKRHQTLAEFLNRVLGLPEGEADAEACRLEHAVSKTVLDRLVAFVEYFEHCPNTDVCWDEKTGFFCDLAVRTETHTTCGRDLEGFAQPAAIAPKTTDEEGDRAMPLTNIQEGRRVVLRAIDGGRQLRGRLTSLGLLPGTELEVVQNSGHGPFVISVRGSRVVIGRSMAARISVE